jgi:hypothetical protein
LTPLELADLLKGMKWGAWLDFDGLRALLQEPTVPDGKPIRSTYAEQRAKERKTKSDGGKRAKRKL